MNLSELIAEARERTNDLTAPYYCSDVRFARLANQAEREACRRSRLIVDSSTDAVCKITIVAGTSVYPLDSRVLFIRRATIDGQDQALVRIHHKDLDKLGTSWLTETGELVGWVVGMDTAKLRLYRIPDASGIARLTVCRLPLDDMTLSPDVAPEIAGRLHLSLVDWMVHRFFDTSDGEMRDPKKAADALADFEREFGPPATAIEEQWAAEHYGFDEDDGNVYS